MTRFVLRSGEVFESERDPSDFDTFCYEKDGQEQTCHLLSFQSEISFLMMLGDDLNLSYEPLQSKTWSDWRTLRNQLCEDSMKSFMHEQERLARQQTWRTTTNGEHWKLWSSGQRRLWTSVKRNQKLWLHRFLSSSDNAKTISESANTLLLELSQWFVCSPEAFRDSATLGLIANPVLTTTKSIDGGSLGCQTDAAGMSHWDAASRLLVYLCKFASINQLSII